MGNSLTAQYSKERKLKLGHRNCRLWTNFQILQMLISSHTQLNSKGQIDIIVQFPCCGVKEKNPKPKEKIPNRCLYRNCNYQLSENGSKILQEKKSLTICHACFEHLITLNHQEQSQCENFDLMLMKILNLCFKCLKIIESQNKMKNYGIQILCDECYLQINDDVQRQSEMDSMNLSEPKTSKSFKSISDFIQQQDLYNSKRFNGTVEKSEKKINHMSEKLFQFDRSQYEDKDKSELIEIIERLSQKIYRFQQVKIQQKSTQQKLNYLRLPNMLKTTQSFQSAKYPELDYSNNIIFVNATSPVYEVNKIYRQVNESLNNYSFNDYSQGNSSINEGDNNLFLDNLKDQITNKSPSFGDSRFAQQAQQKINESLLNIQKEIMYLQYCNSQGKMNGSCLESKRGSGLFESTVTEDDCIGKLNLTAPVNSASNKHDNFSTTKFSHRNSLQLRNSFQ